MLKKIYTGSSIVTASLVAVNAAVESSKPDQLNFGRINQESATVLPLHKGKSKNLKLSQQKLNEIKARSQQVSDKLTSKSPNHRLAAASKTITATNAASSLDWDIFYVPIYIDGASTATNVVISTAASILYVENDTLCTSCAGTGQYAYTADGNEVAFTQVSLQTPSIKFDGLTSSSSILASFIASDSTTTPTWGASCPIGLISSYSGDDTTSGTWTGDASVDGWLGLQSTSSSTNLLSKMYANSLLTSNKFQIAVSWGFSSTQTSSSTFTIGSSSSTTNWYSKGGSKKWSAYIVGFLTSLDPQTDVLSESWILTGENKFLAQIDTSVMATYIPESLYDTVMMTILADSIGYFYDTDLKTYVLSCNQMNTVKDLHIRLEDQTGYTGSYWFTIDAGSYLNEIDTTDQCQIMLKKNSGNSWVLGLSFLNGYIADFDNDSGAFSLTLGTSAKTFSSKKSSVLDMDLTSTVSYTQIALQTVLTGVLGFQVWHHFFYSAPTPPVPHPINATVSNSSIANGTQTNETLPSDSSTNLWSQGELFALL